MYNWYSHILYPPSTSMSSSRSDKHKIPVHHKIIHIDSDIIETGEGVGYPEGGLPSHI